MLLADLLIVVDYIQPAKTQRMALLVQAKMLKAGAIKIASAGGSSIEWRQLDLYQRWPIFDFVSSAYTSTLWDLWDPHALPKVSYSGRYGGIELAGPVMFNNFHPASPMIAPGIGSYGGTLVGMLMGRRGRRAVPGGTDHWSMLIDELLTVTFGKKTSKKLGASPRGVSTFCLRSYDAPDDWWPGPENPPPPENLEGEEWPEGPLSVAYMVFGHEAVRD